MSPYKCTLCTAGICRSGILKTGNPAMDHTEQKPFG